MAFDFLGTFTKSDIDELVSFVEDQLLDKDTQIAYLQGALQKVGWINYTFNDQGKVISYVIEPRGSSLDKLIKRYHYHGGDIKNLPIKSRGQWVSFSKEDPTLDSSKPNAAGSLEAAHPTQGVDNLHADDAVPAVTVDKIKGFLLPTIKYKREDLEFEIKKALDLTDQYLRHMLTLVQRTEGPDRIEVLKNRINFYLGNREFHSAGNKERL